MWKFVACILLIFCAVIFSFGQETVDDVWDDWDGACFENLTTPIGKLTLPNTTLSTGECRWLVSPIKQSEVKAINLFIDELFLHKDDQLTIFKSMDDANNDSLALFVPLHFENSSFAMMSSEKTLVLKLKGNDTSYVRKFHAFYQSQACSFVVSPDVRVLKPPVYQLNFTKERECTYDYNKDPHFRSEPTFSFENFDFKKSILKLDGTTMDGRYDHDPPVDFFFANSKKSMKMTITHTDPTDSFTLRLHMVDSECSGFVKMDEQPKTLKSPDEVFNDGSIIAECRWVVHGATATEILGVDFDTVKFYSALDILSLNDGGSEMSPPIIQITTSTSNSTMKQPIRTSKNYLWIGFKPVSYASKFLLNVTRIGQGGHFNNKGTISMKPTTGNDTVFLLEVEEGKVVTLNFTKSDFTFPNVLRLYDGFEQESPLLATLQGNVWYPVVSPGNKLKIVAAPFATGSFQADFDGAIPGICTHMSSTHSEDYTLTGNCNSTCSWTIPPQNLPDKELQVNLQYVSLNKGDLIEIIQLDAQKTKLGEVTDAVNHVPQLVIPANIGAVVKVTRGPCTEKENKIVLVGHTSYVPGCNHVLSLTTGSTFHVTSPLFPDTYPLGNTCMWTLESQPKTFLHLAFDKLQLAANHCVRVTHSANQTLMFEGSNLPPDMLIPEKAVVEFLSTDCKTGKVGKELVSSEGFFLNGTVADCGGTLKVPSGEFNTSLTGNQSHCVWIVSVPLTSDSTSDDVNIISYSVSKKDATDNYELHVYDGESVRDKEIVNNTNTDIWSRTSNLVFVYHRKNVTKPPTVLVFKFKLISCNSSMQCENKICMHPDWRCDGKNDCGDFTDERNCGVGPVNPIVHNGYSSSSFFGTAFTMLFLGLIAGGVGLILFQKYRNGQYRRFDDVSVIG